MDSSYQNANIRIRPFVEADIANMYALVISSAVEFSKYLPWVTADYSQADSQRWVSWAHYNWLSQRQYDFVVESIANNEFLGGVGLLEVDLHNQCAKLGYWLGTAHTGKGLTTQAAQLAMAFAKNELGLQKLIIRIAEDNRGSIKIAEKLGAKFVGKEEIQEFHNGHWQDTCVYELSL